MSQGTISWAIERIEEDIKRDNRNNQIITNYSFSKEQREIILVALILYKKEYGID